MASEDARSTYGPDDRELYRDEGTEAAAETSPQDGQEAPTRAMNPDRVRRIREMILSYRDRPCSDCGFDYPPEVMEFDHVRGEKTFTISSWNRQKVPDGMSVEDMIRREISKCEVRCPTCHRLRHFFEKIVDPKPGGRRKGKKGGKGFINVAAKQSVNLRGVA